MRREYITLTTVLMFVCLINEIASDPRFKWRWGQRRRRSCQKANCVLGEWSQWSPCSRTCGPRGQSTARKKIIKPARCGGTCLVSTRTKTCKRFCLNGGTLMGSSCRCRAEYSGECCAGKVTGGWTSWGAWCACSKTCGKGTQYRKRSCTKPGGTGCYGSSKENRSCVKKQCNLDGGWTSWSSWGHCTGSCGSGLQTRKRSCTNPPRMYGGKKCSGPAEQYKNCLLQRCPVNGGWSGWHSWGKCSKTCGYGQHYSYRYCNKPTAKYGGKPCVGSNRKTRSCSVKSCAVNGGWSAWGKWCACSKTCGTGSQYRKRSCSKPPAAYGGKPCAGQSKQTKNCNTLRCPVHGSWSRWSKWGACSKTCGNGKQNSKRYCNNPVPKYGGRKCSGTGFKTKACNVKPCPVHGSWSRWSKWGACSKTCGNGKQNSKRYCNNPVPKYGGRKCSGTGFKTKACNVKPCPVHGGWSRWSKWGACSKKCGNGKQNSKRYCNNPVPKYGGRKCSGTGFKTKACNVKPCPVYGGWSRWSKWGACSKTCGNGKQYSKRYCNNPVPKYGGRKCSGTGFKTKACNVKPCPVYGGWSRWSKWGACSKTCGNGKQYSKRYCNNPVPKYGGRKCSGTGFKTKACNVKPCPVHGGWSRWSKWGACSKKCGNGKQNSKRYCNNPVPKYGGRKCSGTGFKTKACNVKPCPVYGGWSRWSKWGACSKTCGNGKQYSKRYCNNPVPKYGGRKCSGTGFKTKACNVKPCPVHGGWSRWSKWGACSKTCGNGKQNSKRYCNNPVPKYGGRKCSGTGFKTKACNVKPCPVNGGWGTWGKWCACSKKCGTGTQYRSRSCNKPSPAYGGKQCPGQRKEIRKCNTKPCPVNGRWSSWAGWSVCSKMCGTGSQARTRSCSNPAPRHGGKKCTGPSKQTKSCLRKTCPIDGGWSAWGKWCACSKTCGTGSQYRKRSCTKPSPSHGGKLCPGKERETRNCNTKHCPAYGGWNSWGAWSSCSKTCGTGFQKRKRTCLGYNPGHEKCPGSNEETRDCNTQKCPVQVVNGGWGAWTEWSSCSLTCGPGTSIRTRQCDNPPPGPGGRSCVGLPVANKPCDMGPCPGNCWGDWSDWSKCTKACGCGQQFRVRFCNCAHGQGHNQCQGLGESSQSCNCNACPNGPPSDDVIEG